MVTCTHCNKENAEGSLICTYCGELLDPSLLPQHVQTRNLGENDTGENQPRWGTARFDDQTRLILRITETSHILHVDAHKPNGVILGRADPETGRKPEVDLTMFDAMDLGVSRRHARLDIHDESLYVTDLGSANSTYLNGLRLTAHQPRILRDSDEIRLGHLTLQVTFIEARTQTQRLQQPRSLDSTPDLRTRDIAGTPSTKPPVITEPEPAEEAEEPVTAGNTSLDDTLPTRPADFDVSKVDTAELKSEEPEAAQEDTDDTKPTKPEASKVETAELPSTESEDHEISTAELPISQPDPTDLETADLRDQEEEESVETAKLLNEVLDENDAKLSSNGTASEV